MVYVFFFVLPYFVNSFLGDNCVYDNQIFYANQSIITSNCAERRQCHHINGTKITKCKPLCPIEEDPKCHPYSEKIKEFKESQNDTNCTCTHKKCVSGINTSQYFSMSLKHFTFSLSRWADKIAECIWKSSNSHNIL